MHVRLRVANVYSNPGGTILQPHDRKEAGVGIPPEAGPGQAIDPATFFTLGSNSKHRLVTADALGENQL